MELLSQKCASCLWAKQKMNLLNGHPHSHTHHVLSRITLLFSFFNHSWPLIRLEGGRPWSLRRCIEKCIILPFLGSLPTTYFFFHFFVCRWVVNCPRNAKKREKSIKGVCGFSQHIGGADPASFYRRLMTASFARERGVHLVVSPICQQCPDSHQLDL